MRWIIRLVVAFLLVAGLGLAGLFLLPGDRIARLAGEQITKATGRSVSMSGDVRPSFYPQLGVSTGRVEVANADWSDAGPMLVAEKLSIGVDLWALIGGTVKVGRVEAVSPRIMLEKNKDGQVNWDFSSAIAANSTSSRDQKSAVKPFSLERALITDGALSYVDHGTGARAALTEVTADLSLPEFTGPVALDLSARMDGQPFRAKLGISGFGDFIEGAVSPVALSLQAGGSDIAFDGQAGIAPVAATGVLKADISDPVAVMALAGLGPPDLPKGLGQSIGVSGNVTYTDGGTVTLREGVIRLDQNRLAGSADLFLDKTLRINGQFTTEALDLSALGIGAGAGGSAAAPSAGWSRSVIDVSGLSALDAEVSLAATSVDLGAVELGKTRLLFTNDRGRAVFDLAEMQVYGGGLTGQFVVNGRGGLSVGADLNATGIKIEPLLSALADYDRLSGATDFRVKFLASGNSMDALANSLSGSGGFSIGKGELRGFDLAGMIRTLDANYEGAGAKTIFDSIEASFTMDKGVLYNDDLLLKAPVLIATGEGQVGIGSRTLNYRITPTKLLKADGSAQVRVPVLVSGSWAKPKFTLDLKSLADEKLAAEKEKIEAKARAKVEEKLQKDLGVTVEEGQSVEDALKQKLEEEAAKGLLKLLGKRN